MAEQLTPGTFELDSQTFDAGLLNSHAIIEALKRSDLFVLFLSENSANSPYVDFEVALGVELVAKGLISKVLVICLDEAAFFFASETIKFFNIVRRSSSPESIARLVQGALIVSVSDKSDQVHPFIGRESTLRELEGQLIDPSRKPTKALYISGNHGSGRRTIAKKLYANQYPQVGIVFPQIEVGEFSGPEELFRIVLAALRPSLPASQLRTRLASFSMADFSEKTKQIADLLNSLPAAREAAFVLDQGGILADDGSFEPEISAVLDLLNARPHPAITIISPRMMPFKMRRPGDVAYASVLAFERQDALRLAGRLFKDNEIEATQDQMDEFIALMDGHPFNFYRAIDEVNANSLGVFLSDPTNFVSWKHRYASEYLGKVNFKHTDELVLGILRLLPSLDFSAIVEALPISAAEISDSLVRLGDLHVLEHSGDNFQISPALRLAVERDKRVNISSDVRTAAFSAIAKSLEFRIEEGGATIALIDSAVMAAIEANADNSAFVTAFLLPSHYVWLAKRNYDQRNFKECISLAKLALKGAGRLASSAFVAACRYMCLAAARLGEGQVFDDGIARLASAAHDDWARSNVAFLRGFNLRMHGNLPQAETEFRESYRVGKGNTSAAREIAAICLVRGNLEEAEKFAREALRYAPTNPYIVDMLISVLIRKLGRRAFGNAEVVDMLEILERVGEEDGRSFYSTRMAELEHLWGDNRKALVLIEEAVKKTPTIFDARRLHAEVLLKEGNVTRAAEVISWMRDRVNARDASERRSNYRLYLETQAHYLTEVGQYRAAKDLFDEPAIFTKSEKEAAIRDIEIVQGFAVKGR